MMTEQNAAPRAKDAIEQIPAPCVGDQPSRPAVAAPTGAIMNCKRCGEKTVVEFRYAVDAAEVKSVKHKTTEMSELRAVFEAARHVLRFNGVDNERTVEALLELDDACEAVKLRDSGLADDQ